MASIGTFNIDGLASGLDTKSIISQMLSYDRLPLVRMQQQKANSSAKLPLLQDLSSMLLTLKNLAADLKLSSAYATRKGSSSDAAKASVSVAADAPLGTHTLDSVTRLATATRATSTGTLGGPADTGATFDANGMRTKVTEGVFTINGATFTVVAGDTLQSVIGQINGQSGATGVTASYDAGRDKLVLRKAAGDTSTVVLGGSGDTSNFLSATGVLGAWQDTSGGYTRLESAVHLGAVDKTKTLDQANLAEPLVSGNFRINGVMITVDAAADTLETLLSKINASAAGVTATYNQATDKLEVVNKTTGATRIDFVAGTSNLLDALNLESPAAASRVSAIPPLTGVSLAASKTTTTIKGGNNDFYINGVLVNNITSGGDIQAAITKINAVSGASGVKASYDPATGIFELANATPGDTSAITVSDRADGSNFSRVMKLAAADGAVEDTSSGTTVLRSAAPIATIDATAATSDTLGAANFATPLVFTGGAAGRLRVTHDGVTKTFDYTAATTVYDLLQAIDGDADLAVDASYDPAADRFLFAGEAGTGAAVAVEDVANGASSGNLAAIAGLASDPQTLGEDAEYELDGLTYYSSSNTIADKVEGMTFTLLGATSTAVTLTATADADEAKNRVKAFVANYNGALAKLNELITAEGGVFYKDSTLRDVMGQMKRLVNTRMGALEGDYKSLSDIGITTGEFGMAWTEGYIGTLQIDEAKLSAALSADPDGVQSIFYHDPNGGSAYTGGVGKLFEDALAALTDSDGTFYRSQQLVTEEIADLGRKITDLEAQLEVKESYYQGIFTTLEVNMGKLQRQSQWLSSQLASLGGFSSGTKSSSSSS